MRIIAVASENDGQRLDRLLLKYLNKAPKSFIYKMLRKKNIKLNGSRADGSERVKSGDEITLYLSEETLDGFMESARVEKAGKIDIIYEDSAVLIVNKPQGLAVQRDKAHTGDTLNDRILYYLYKTGVYSPDAGSTFTPSVCNRLDFNTAGIVTAGKSLEGLRELNRAFRERLVDKFYTAMVVGEVKEGGTVKGYQVKSGKSNVSTLTAAKTEDSLYVCTHYRPLKCSNGYTLLEIKLETGRSHQIRVALASIRHPIVGDMKYGNEATNNLFLRRYGLDGQLLCCSKLKFKIDGKLSYLNNRVLEAPLPDKTDKILVNYFNAD